ncbi:thiamine phosphate synthase [Paucilactobacillus sp. N302-9]
MKFNAEMLKAYLVGGTQDLGDPSAFLPKIEALMKAGITAFQLREKGTSRLNEDERYELALQCKQLTTKYQIPLIIDDDFPLAIKIQADGVHVGQKDRRVEAVIDAVGDDMFVGYSCNTAAEIRVANQLPQVAYVGSGPIYPTNSKADADPAIGTTGLKNLLEVSDKPIVAIGGITEKNVPDVLATGVSGISSISMFLNSANIEKTMQIVLNQ